MKEELFGLKVLKYVVGSVCPRAMLAYFPLTIKRTILSLIPSSP